MNSSLAGCVSSIKASLSLLDSSISILDSGISDFPRLTKVLSTQRHFELLPESSLSAAQIALRDEIAPEVTTLLQRVETHLAKMERKEQALIAKAELQDGRLAQHSTNRLGKSAAAGGRASAAGSAPITAAGENAERLKALRAKKERLNYTVQRLNLQAGHKERQLRMSMAAQ